MTPSQDCYDIITAFESFKGSPYPCQGGVWTIGYGTTTYPNGKAVRPTDHPITRDKALAYMRRDVERFAADVASLVDVPLQQCMFDALVSFAYNVGSDIDADKIPEGLGDSRLLKLLNAGDYYNAADEFQKWNKAKGLVSNGLIRRRDAERALFRGDAVWRVIAEI